ncbi:MAG TPA: hypothetical protein VM621_10550 [Luteibacter sp.]|uniref:hypothetical protein n=1 Tax=Luteibacter sp. TaxID=1886636 RepID=UPI002D047775|nr:hypothetical protein [Luteibacter sp.]HVI55477.1 hypothetical protein [Luteibacter sp.]
MAGKGAPKTGGRQKGVPNKTTATLKEMILEALDKKGGVDYLVKQAESSPSAFMTLLGKVLPTQVSGDPDNPLVAGLTISFVKAEHDRVP